MLAIALLLSAAAAAVAATEVAAAAPPAMLHADVVTPKGHTLLRSSGDSRLYRVDGIDGYDTPPLVALLRGDRHQIGYDYAALLHAETAASGVAFLQKVFAAEWEQVLVRKFADYLWTRFFEPATPRAYLDELAGMAAWHAKNPAAAADDALPTHFVASMFYTLASLPADGVNIVAALERDEERGWPDWLKESVNELVKLLERLVHSCDAYAAWGPRTAGGRLYSSRNLDYNSDTGINRAKLLVVYDVRNDSAVRGPYASVGFAVGLGALAGVSDAGVTVSEMNLDNNVTTFRGAPFPLRLRDVLERAVSVDDALRTWNRTANSNSFNFLIASAADSAAVALETTADYTAVFAADSPVERAATYDCSRDPSCHKWTNSTSPRTPIGAPLPHAVWRTNHGLSPRVMRTQEPLFNNTVFRYNLLHDLFAGLERAAQPLINDSVAVDIVATLGIKGANYLTCDQPLLGDNTMSIAYAPTAAGTPGARAYIAWESHAGAEWRPAACSPYVRVDLDKWFAMARA